MINSFYEFMKRDNVAYMAKDKKNLNFILAITA
jgi:hypothetical protein